MTKHRRTFLKLAAATAAVVATGGAASASTARVVVIGGGYGGATAAKYLRLRDPSIDVTLVEREPLFTSCPLSNLVLGGHLSIAEIQRPYAGIERHGVRVVHDDVARVDPVRKTVTLRRGGTLGYDRLVVSPGVDFLLEEIRGLDAANRAGRILHAWKAGRETQALRAQLENMRDGGVYVLSVPLAPYRCAPAPYERACQVASYFKAKKPRSKVLVVDANPDLTSKGLLFRRAWTELYPGMVEYRADSQAIGVEEKTQTLKLEFEDVRGDVINVVPPQRAGDIALRTGLVTHNNRWCEVDWRTMESTAVPGIHVLGDATLSAPAMPKSGHMANSQAKVAVAAIIEMLNGRTPNAAPEMASSCYSFVSDTEAVHLASVHQWNEHEKTVSPVPGAGGLSPARSTREAVNGRSWARTIWADMLS